MHPARTQPMCRPSAAAAAAFFDTHGFVVYSGVLDAAECAATRAEIHDQLGANHPGFDPADCASWDLLSAKTYGLPPKQAIFTAQILRNRQNPKLIKAFSSVGRRTPAPPPSFLSTPTSVTSECRVQPSQKKPPKNQQKQQHSSPLLLFSLASSSFQRCSGTTGS